MSLESGTDIEAKVKPLGFTADRSALPFLPSTGTANGAGAIAELIAAMAQRCTKNWQFEDAVGTTTLSVPGSVSNETSDIM